LPRSFSKWLPGDHPQVLVARRVVASSITDASEDGRGLASGET